MRFGGEKREGMGYHETILLLRTHVGGGLDLIGACLPAK